MSLHCIGIDLAWSYRNTTGAAVLRWDGTRAETVELATLRTDEEIVDLVARHAGSDVLVAVDAPLQVPNETGTRPCDLDVQRRFRAAHAGPLPANRRLLQGFGGGVIRGERLVDLLGLLCNPIWQPRELGLRRVVEMFPHAVAVSVFGLSRIFEYKRRRGRTPEFCRQELQRLQDHLQSLAGADPPATFPRLDLRSALKKQEDLLDAMLCAYGALHAWWRPAEVFGDAASGHILVPRGRPEQLLDVGTNIRDVR